MSNHHDPMKPNPPPTAKVVETVDRAKIARRTEHAPKRGAHATTVQSAPAIDPSWPVVPGYEILKELGRGSMGVVYKAKQANLDRTVALKLIRSAAGMTSESLARFVEEARLVASLQHPNIIQVYEIHIADDAPFFSMELAEGGNLADHIHGQPQPIQPSARLVETLARAINAAHVRGIVHRDLKPANILLTTIEVETGRRHALADSMMPNSGVVTWTPKITDFGLAKQLDGVQGRTESGMILGTPSYMAPEQAEGKSRDVGPAADVYALGAILYEMLTGRPPYAGESPLETMLQLFQIDPVPPTRLQPKIPRDLETICLKCLHKEQAKRYPNGNALAEDLQRFLAGEAILARPASVPERIWKWSKRRPALATLLGAVGMAMFVLAALAGWHESDLRDRLDDAILDERQAREGQEVASQRERLATYRATMDGFIRAGQTAKERNDWATVRVQLLRARDVGADEPDLADLRTQIDRLLSESEIYRQVRERLQQFQQFRNDALFHASLFTGSDLATSLDETSQAAKAALALFGALPDDKGEPNIESPHLAEKEKADVRNGCFELLLILADAAGQPRVDASADDQRMQALASLRILDRAAVFGIPSRASHVRRAHFLEQAGEPDAAKRERAKAGTILVETEFDFFVLGTEQFRRGNTNEAIQSLESVLQKRPEHFWGHYYLALCWLKVQKPDLAAARLTTCLGWRPDLPWLYLLRGSAWAEMNQFARAEEDFAAAMKGELSNSGRYGLFINRGVVRVRQGRTAEAIDDLTAATKLRPDLYQGYLNLGQALAKAERVDEAIRQLDIAIDKAPTLASLPRTRARLNLLKKDDEAALADLNQAIDLESYEKSLQLADDYVERGRVYHRRNDYKAAVASYDSAVVLLPRQVRVHRLRAEALLELGQFAEAVRSLDICVRYGPQDAEVYRARASIRARTGDYPGAQVDYTRAIEIRADAATYAARGWTYVLSEAPALALRDFQEAIRLEPTRADGYSGRGYARVLSGQYRGAIADAEEALRLGPPSSRLYYNAARVYAQAAAQLAVDAKRDSKIALSLPTQWQERSVTYLRNALELQPEAQRAHFWQANIKNDPALAPVRDQLTFKRLAASLPAYEH